jgi:hypothetical protein
LVVKGVVGVGSDHIEKALLTPVRVDKDKTGYRSLLDCPFPLFDRTCE